MSRRICLLVFAALAGAACSDQGGSTVPPVSMSTHGNSPSAARERLAQALAVALAEPSTRAAVKRRLDASNAPEGKLQFQALMHSDQSMLMTALARAGASTPVELLSDLTAARGLELYLPVPAQRAAWTGDAHFLVATAGNDRDQPVAFDAHGTRYTLDRATPPDTPVLALVPQETDFTRGHPSLVMSCVDMCGADNTGGWTGDAVTWSPPVSGTSGAAGAAPGVYLVQSHFNDSYEGWLKGSPEFEFHVYGIGDNGESVQLTCTAEQQAGVYQWDQNDNDWSGSVMLISDADYKAYQAKHPNAPIRIVAWEDDDEACVDRADVNNVSRLVTAVDNAYNTITSGKSDPLYIHGLKSAVSIFNLVGTLHSIILTNDDFIGNAVEGTVTGDAPNGSNWVLKTNGTVTTGWFTTKRVQ